MNACITIEDSDRFNHTLPVSTVAPASKTDSDSAALVKLTHDPAVLTLPEANWQHQVCDWSRAL
jgi:hypothetical protein